MRNPSDTLHIEGTHRTSLVGEDHVEDDSILGQSFRTLPAQSLKSYPTRNREKGCDVSVVEKQRRSSAHGPSGATTVSLKSPMVRARALIGLLLIICLP
jgi:hypothetical protein